MTATAAATTAPWIRGQVPKRGTRSSAGAGAGGGVGRSGRVMEVLPERERPGRSLCDNPPVITGFNTDVRYRGLVYHVQTEDKGKDNPLIETLIYKGGEILASRRLPYADIVSGPDTEKAITHLMEEQHKAMILEVKKGRWAPPEEAGPVEDLSLDEIVLAYLAARAARP